ncbi:MAG TPA: hypothetical protein VGW98_12875 [Solirubrobacteraceae bacterium]|jgi:hypothetical protein|nr:hypothetical protein [Solirubrobacteraceae bacterium]
MNAELTTDAYPAPDTDAAMVLGMAATAMPFARSNEDQAERWLRILRLHGEAGTALQALGVSEAPLESTHHTEDAGQADRASEIAADVVAKVTGNAMDLAGERGAHALSTTDVLVAVMRVYGSDFDRVLRVHGTDHDEVLERLGQQAGSAEH